MTITWINIVDEFPWAFSLITLAGLYGIWYALWYEMRFKLALGFLVIDSPLRAAKRFNMEDLVAWQDYAHNIRAQRRKTLILVFTESKKVVVDNSQHKDEFEALLVYIKNTHARKKSGF